jgi:pimeloyl-ACP methyl ester carboxylesterase
LSDYRREFVNVRGLSYGVHRWGDEAAPVIFMLHGWGDTGRTFELLVKPLLPAWQVIAPDWRGFGASDWAPGEYYFPDYLADLDCLLGHYSPDQSVRLVGHSMGGNVAALYAGSRPQRVAALANLEGFGLKDADPASAPGRYARWLTQLRSEPEPPTFADFDQLAERIRSRHPSLPVEMARFAARHWGRRIGDRVILKADPRHRQVNPVLYRRAEALACWSAVTAPVLLVIGAASAFASGGAKFLDNDDGAAVFARARRIVIPDAGHMLHLEQPQVVVGYLREFFEATTTEGEEL